MPFKPDPSKNVYCNECFEEVKAKKQAMSNDNYPSQQPSGQSFQDTRFSNTPREDCRPPKTNIDIEKKRKEIKDKIDSQGLSDMIKNIFRK